MVPVGDIVRLTSVLRYEREAMTMLVDTTRIRRTKMTALRMVSGTLMVRNVIVDNLAPFFLNSPVAQLEHRP